MNKPRKKYASYTQVSDNDMTPIGALVKSTGLPHKIANKLIGKSETETEESIRMFIDWFKECHTSKVKFNRQCGGAQYGYKYNLKNMLVLEPAEQETIQLINQLKNNGCTYIKIADELNNMGVKPRRAPKWKGDLIRNVHQKNKNNKGDK